MNREEVSKIVKEKILYEGLSLENLDLTVDDLTDDRILFGPQGIGIDSVDSLEILMGIKKYFKVEITNANADFFAEYFATVGGIINYMHDKVNEKQ